MGTVFDVSGNSAYAPGGAYHGTRDPPPSPWLLLKAASTVRAKDGEWNKLR